ncbi:hypothetical protein CYMTET_48670 [Cymbomonas tetramitiformis]|uniref:Uncharacterized protein n=1 Tax=Cymbomonas tetramitiformis TaxID=36881 RepID=A0AAE0EUQ2_9CHLO|nr:hypothetical protein CYMTET_48670 [Cymbomonas tetramitiformis]
MGVNHSPRVMRRILQSRGFTDVDWTQVVVTDTDARGGHAWNLDGPFVLEMSPEDFCCAHMERAVQPRFDARVPVHRHDPGVTNMGRRVERGGAERTAQELELDPTHVYRVPSRPGASAAAPRTFADDHALLQQMTTFRTQAPSAGQPSERRSDDDDDDDDAMDIDDLGDDAMETNGIIASTGVFDPHGWHDAMCKQASTEGERLISSLHIGSVVLNRVVAARRGSIERECGGDLPRARRRFDAAQDSWLRNWYMSLMSGELPMSVALKRATEPFIGMLSRDLRKNPGDRNSLNHPRAPYTYGWRLTSGMQYVAMTWEFMDRAVNINSLHALAMQMHFCMSSVYCQKWKSNNKRLPHMWVCGVHQVGKSYVMEEVSRVTLPDAMRNLVTGQTAGSYFPSNQYTSCDEEHCTYFAELYNEMPPTLMGLRNADDDRVAKLKAALTGDGMSHKRLVPGVDSRGERGGYMNETVKIFPRYLIVSLMNQPYYRIPNALRSRATPHEAMKVPRGAVSTVCERARGSYITHFPQMSFDVPFGDAPQRLGERMRNPRANFKCEDAELLMSLRARHTVLVILYAVAVRLRVCRGPSMKEVKMRQRNFERVLERLGFTLEDPSRRLADLYSMAYAHTMHAAVWRALSSDRSLVDASARQFTPELFREVDKCAVCSSSVALYSFSTLVNSLMSKPIRMILFYAGQQCVQHGQEPLHPTDTALDDADADTRYCIIHSTFEAKASSVPPKAAQEVILKRFAASVVGYYSDARVARKHSTDKLESEYVEGLLNTLLTQPHKDARSDSLITPLRWVQEESGMSLAVTSSHVPEDPTTATLENDALDVHSIMRACVTSNVRCQRLLYNDHARTVGEGGRLTQLPQCPKHYDVPQHDAECAIVRVEEELDDDALLRQLVDAGVGVRDRNTLRADLEESLATVRAREEHAAPGQVVDPFLSCRADYGCTCFRSAGLRHLHASVPSRDVLEQRIAERDPIPEDTAYDVRMRYYYHRPHEAWSDPDTLRAYHPTLGLTDRSPTRDYPVEDIAANAV